MMALIIRPKYEAWHATLFWSVILQPFPNQALFFWQQRTETEEDAWCTGFNLAIEFMAKEHHR